MKNIVLKEYPNDTEKSLEYVTLSLDRSESWERRTTNDLYDLASLSDETTFKDSIQSWTKFFLPTKETTKNDILESMRIQKTQRIGTVEDTFVCAMKIPYRGMN